MKARREVERTRKLARELGVNERKFSRREIEAAHRKLKRLAAVPVLMVGGVPYYHLPCRSKA